MELWCPEFTAPYFAVECLLTGGWVVVALGRLVGAVLLRSLSDVRPRRRRQGRAVFGGGTRRAWPLPVFRLFAATSSAGLWALMFRPSYCGRGAFSNHNSCARRPRKPGLLPASPRPAVLAIWAGRSLTALLGVPLAVLKKFKILTL